MTKLGIIGAMEIEVAILKGKLENAKATKIGPMGCRTGFYLLLAGDLNSDAILPLVTGCFKFIAEYEGEIPGATAKDCGNYKDMDLRVAKAWAERYYALLRTIDEDRLVYPV